MANTVNAGARCPHPRNAQIRLEGAKEAQAICIACGLVFPVDKK